MKIVELIPALRKHQGTAVGYTAAFLIFLAALVIRELLDPYIAAPYITLFPMMVLCSLVAGRPAGIMSACVGGIVSWYLWLPPRGTQREPAMILSVLIAELMLNSCKHAFDQRQHGTITMELAPEGNRCRFVFSDDGNGLPKDFDLRKSTGLGAQIMQGLTLQLGGTICMESGGRGTTVTVTFPATVRGPSTAQPASSSPSFNQAE